MNKRKFIGKLQTKNKNKNKNKINQIKNKNKIIMTQIPLEILNNFNKNLKGKR